MPEPTTETTEKLQEKLQEAVNQSFYETNEEELVAIIEELIKRGVDVNSPLPGSKQTLLYTSTIYDKREIANLLIKHGADVNAEAQGNTPLTLAALNGNLEMIELLIELGADTQDFVSKKFNKPLKNKEGVEDIISRQKGSSTAIGYVYGQLTRNEIRDMYKVANNKMKMSASAANESAISLTVTPVARLC